MDNEFAKGNEPETAKEGPGGVGKEAKQRKGIEQCSKNQEFSRGAKDAAQGLYGQRGDESNGIANVDATNEAFRDLGVDFSHAQGNEVANGGKGKNTAGFHKQ